MVCRSPADALRPAQIQQSFEGALIAESQMIAVQGGSGCAVSLHAFQVFLSEGGPGERLVDFCCNQRLIGEDDVDPLSGVCEEVGNRRLVPPSFGTRLSQHFGHEIDDLLRPAGVELRAPALGVGPQVHDGARHRCNHQ